MTGWWGLIAAAVVLLLLGAALAVRYRASLRRLGFRRRSELGILPDRRAVLRKGIDAAYYRRTDAPAASARPDGGGAQAVRASNAGSSPPPVHVAPPSPAMARRATVDRSFLSKLLREGSVRFATSQRLQKCNCEVQDAKGVRPVRVWGEDAVNGPDSIVLHAIDGDNEWAVKIYAPSGQLAAEELAEVDKKLARLNLSSFPSPCSFIPDGMSVDYQSTTHRFNIGLMPWLKSDRAIRLDEFVTLYRSSPVMMAAVARELRKAFVELACHEIAHGDICAANIVVTLRADRCVEAVQLLDTDTLTWREHTSISGRIIGQPGYYTEGRQAFPDHYVSMCTRDLANVHMIDAPAALITYVSILGYVLTEQGALPEPEATLAFKEDDVIDRRYRSERLGQLRRVFAGVGGDSRAIEALLEKLDAHCASIHGVDLSQSCPFTNADITASLERFEAMVAGRNG